MQNIFNELVFQAQKKERSACSKLYQLTFKSSYYLALRLVGDEANAAKVISQSYKQAFETISTLKNPEKFEIWIQHITAKYCVEFAKEKKRIDFKNSVSNFSDRIDEYTEFLPNGIENADKVCSATNKIIDSLSEEQKTVVLLHYYNKMPVPHIARIIGCSEAVIVNELELARFNIKAKMDKMINRKTQIYPMAGDPIIATILQKAKEQQAISEDFLKLVFNNATEGLFNQTDKKANNSVAESVPAENIETKKVIPNEKPVKKASNKKINQKTLLISVMIIFLVVALGAVAFLVIPMISPSEASGDNQTLKPDSEMLLNIEPYEESYNNIMKLFYEASVEENDYLDLGFNFIYFNNNDIPDLAINYKRYYTNAPETYDEIIIFMDGETDESFTEFPDSTWFGTKGSYIVLDNMPYGSVKAEAYYKYNYINEKNDKEFCGGLKYEKFLNDDTYEETWIYMAEAESSMLYLSGWDEYYQKKEELLNGYYRILSSYVLSDYIDSGNSLIKYLKKAKQEVFINEVNDEQTLLYDSSTTSITLPQTTTQQEKTAATVKVVAATKSDWSVLEDTLECIMRYNGNYSYKSSDAYDWVLCHYGDGHIYRNYFKSGVDSGYGNDPSGYFKNDEYCIFDADNVDWIIENIFNQTPKHNLNKTDRYFHSNKYYSLFCPSGGPIAEYEIEQYEKQKDKFYSVRVKQLIYPEFYETPEENIPQIAYVTLHVALKNIDGKKYWSFYAIERKESKPELTTTIPPNNESESFEWERNYKKVLNGETDDFFDYSDFTLKDLDGNGTPELVIIDRTAQTDWMFIFMNGDIQEDERIDLSATDLYVSSNGEIGTYRIYASGGEYDAAFSKISLGKSRANNIESALHFEGFADPVNKTGKKEEWRYYKGTDEEGELITQAEYEDFVESFKSEFKKVPDYSVSSYRENPKALSSYIQ
ncbi:MAG: hypothetical protein IKB93_01440 [Clostridia bacterium]|nr:hypothetical protein [Clostridia bacterium]